MGNLSGKIKSKFTVYLLIFSILALGLSNFMIITLISAKSKYALSIFLNNYFVSSNTINDLINKLVTSPFVSHITVFKKGVIYKDLAALSDSYNYILTKTFIGKTGIYKVKLFISLPDLVIYLYKKFLYLSFLLTILFDIFLLIAYRTVRNDLLKPLEILFKNIKERRINKLISIKNREFFEIQKELEDLLSLLRISQQKLRFIGQILEMLAKTEDFKKDFKNLLLRLINSFPQIDGFILIEKEDNAGLLVKVFDKNFEKEFKIDKESFSLYAFNLVNPKIVPEVNKLGVLAEEEKELHIKDAYVIPINLFSQKVGSFVVYSHGKLLLSEIEKEFFKLLGFTLFLALILDRIYKDSRNLENLKKDLLIKGILNYLNILENRYIYLYKTQRIIKLIDKLKDPLKELNLDLKKLKETATFMDIGLFMMPDKLVLNPPETLDENEKSLYEIHPIISSIYINNLSNFDSEVKNGVLDHHENIDGSGFPSQKKGEEISIYARTLRILDDFDTFLYKENKENALKKLEENKGKYYDPNILEKLIPHLQKINEENLKVNSLLPDEILELYKKVLDIENINKNNSSSENLQNESN